MASRSFEVISSVNGVGSQRVGRTASVRRMSHFAISIDVAVIHVCRIMNNSGACTMTAIQEAEQAGIDLSLIDESLRCSYEQRALQHQAAINLALELERVGQQLRDQTNELPMKKPY